MLNTQGKLKELKQSDEAAFEAKSILEDELELLNHLAVMLSKTLHWFVWSYNFLSNIHWTALEKLDSSEIATFISCVYVSL